MDDGQKGVVRTALEMQFRYRFYQDTVFPFYQSMGIKDVFQGFGNEEDGFIGMLHLWWVPEESNIHYDNPKKFPVKIIGVWKGEWFDTAQEGMAIAQKIEDERNKVYDTNKMIDTHRAYMKSVMEKQMRQQIREKEEENLESEKKILWN
jgi:hypothetical protein